VLLVRIVYLLHVVFNVLFSSVFSTASHCSASYAVVKQKLNVIYIILIVCVFISFLFYVFFPFCVLLYVVLVLR